MAAPRIGTKEELLQTLTARGIDPNRLSVDERGTIVRSLRAPPIEATKLVSVEGTPADEIVVRAPLSKGGMGEILLATQTSLGRYVAVKRAHGALAEHHLMLEARVVGALEHPNIVPVHLVGAGGDGSPLLVMKRIEGRAWSALLKEGRSQTRDLGILMDVCRALAFAHSRGILHRDVKPGNVMVGSFGEVYLLDWGIAVALDDRAPPELPRAGDGTLSGTPAYMAPEMALPLAAADARTDVFLVGAVLHELITGLPPNERATMDESLFAAYSASEPTFASDVPPELAAICRRAMRREPGERFRSADDLRTALAAFVGHTAAREIGAAAEARLARLQRLAVDSAPDEALALFGECRFGFEQALRAWPDADGARAGLGAAIATMARREIAAGHFDSAKLLLAELKPAPDDLAAGLAELGRRREHEIQSVAELVRVAHESDHSVGDRQRALVLAANGGGWLALSIVAAILHARGIYDVAGGVFALFTGASLAFELAVAALVPGLRATAASRKAFLAIVLGTVAPVLLFTLGWALDLGTAPLLAVGHLVFATSMAGRAADDERVWPSAGTAAAAIPLLLVAPAHCYLISGVIMSTAIFTAAAVARTTGSRSRSPRR